MWATKAVQPAHLRVLKRGGSKHISVPVYDRIPDVIRVWGLLDPWELICQWRNKVGATRARLRGGRVTQYRSRATNRYHSGKVASRTFSSWIDAKSFHTMKQGT